MDVSINDKQDQIKESLIAQPKHSEQEVPNNMKLNYSNEKSEDSKMKSNLESMSIDSH
jgi:hypothetical protein